MERPISDYLRPTGNATATRSGAPASLLLNEKPLAVDLDGTLLLTDLLHESALRLLRNQPLCVPALALQLVAGKAAAKHYIARRTELDPATLPYNQEFLQWLKKQHEGGRRLVLCTASNRKFAEQVADFLGIFEVVMASDAHHNLKGADKAAALCERFGRGGFDYAGNSAADVPIWAASDRAIVVNAKQDVAGQAEAVGTVAMRFSRPAVRLRDWTRLLRVQQWLKNLLLFAPLLAAHQWSAMHAFPELLLAFLAFSLTASGTYILNDLLDLDSDRLHPRKRSRGLASGNIPLWSGLMAVPALLISGLVLGGLVGELFLICLSAYLVLTCSYSWFLKRFILLDCIALAVLYTLRIIAGAAAVDMGLSFWLLAFSAFLFLSLAFVKRYAELEVQLLEGREKVHGRDYLTSDAALVQTLGISAGYVAVLVLSLYLNSEEVLLLYATPELVWGAVLILLYWISWMWVQAHRGLMHDDPLVFAIMDRTSLIAGALFLAVVYLGTLNWSW